MKFKVNDNPKRSVRLSPASITGLLALLPLLLATTACDSTIYDYEGDCEPHHKVRFVYDYNLKYADAFPNEVKQITLYLLDPETLRVVWARRDASPAVSAPGYMMDVDIAPGNYRMVAWGGEGIGPDFTVDHTDPAISGASSPLQCHFSNSESTISEDGLQNTSRPLGDLYNGYVSIENFSDSQGVHIHTVRMVKDTNDIHVILQNVNGKSVDPDDFDITIQAGNGHLDYDNSPLAGFRRMAYHPWYKNSVAAGVEMPDGSIDFNTRSEQKVRAALADLRTSRLLTGDGQTLTVSRKDGSKVLSIPLTDYCTMVKGKFRQMDDQEYLDRQDDYSMVFFLDDGNEWIDSYIYINSWRIVLDNVDI